MKPLTDATAITSKKGRSRSADTDGAERAKQAGSTVSPAAGRADAAIAALLATLSSPVLLTLWLLVKSDGGPGLYRQERIGKDGRLFNIYKFRTMVPDAADQLEQLLALKPSIREEWAKDQKLRNDPRITRIGKFLRKSSLDELPQLLNVINGEMRLIGPRPVVRNEIGRYGRSARHYLSVTPGMTGLWQVSGRNKTNYRLRVALDRLYVTQRCVSLDVWIMLKTLEVVLRRDGAY